MADTLAPLEGILVIDLSQFLSGPCASLRLADLGARVPGQATLEAVRPYVEHCLEQFGLHRTVWGSDWPVCTITSDLRTWVNVTRQLIAAAGESNQRQLLHGNAMRIYGLDE